ncbi:MAG: glycosyltransferase 87 family protein [Thermodesulfobacteriota bacterium]
MGIIGKTAKYFNQKTLRLLAYKNEYDLRPFLISIIILYFLIIYISSFFMSYHLFWRNYLGVPALSPGFADLRGLLSGVESYREGYDPYLDNPHDPFGRKFNYPRIWLNLSVLGITQSLTNLVGIIFAFLFFILLLLIFNKINLGELVFYALAIISPTVMLSVERGNTDLVIFMLIVLGLLILNSKKNSSFWGYFLLIISTILKLFPIFAFASVLREKKGVCIFTSIFALIIFSLYIYLSNDFFLISRNTPRSMGMSYGGLITFDWINTIIKRVLEFNIPRPTIIIIYGIFIFFIFLLSYVLAAKFGGITKDYEPSLHLDAYRTGSFIFIGTFIYGNNFDYRLIFLLIVLPQMTLWIKEQKEFSKTSKYALILLILTLYLSRLGPNYNLNIDEFINWTLLIYFIWTNLVILPNWAKKIVFLGQVKVSV